MSSNYYFSFFVIDLIVLSRFIFQSYKLQSMNFIFNPSFITAKVLEIIVKFGAITSSPCFKFNALIATSSAAVPLDTATAFCDQCI